MGDKTKYRAAEITAWPDRAHERRHPGRDPPAGRVIAGAWNRCEFYASATGLPLAAALTASGLSVAALDRVADGLARRFGVHLHDVAAWDREPHWRKEIST